MYLWQIRYIPNRPQTSPSLTFFAVTVVTFAVTSLLNATFAFGQPADGAKEKAAGAAKDSAATELFNQVRQELQKHQSIKAEMLQNVSIGDQQFKVTGHYLSSGNTDSGLKLKLDYSVIPDQGAEGKMLEVCDGKELWTMLTFPGSKRVTHRNILQIQKAVAAVGEKSGPEAKLNIELGLGGLTALLASLDRTMVFDAIKQEPSDGHNRTLIQGHWKKEIAQRFPKEKNDALPAFVPDFVRLYVNPETLFPERILYLKKQPEKKTLKSLVSLEFQNVVLDGPVDDESFVFDIPKDVIPEDITKNYVDRLTPPAEAPPKK